MSLSFPELPRYGFSWRSIQIEPVPLSGERITIGAIVKGDDQELIAAKLISKTHLKKIYGREFGMRIAEALSLCIDHAEKFYAANPLSNKWSPPLDRFYVGELHSTVAEDIEEGLLRAARHSSSFSVSLEAEKSGSNVNPAVSAPKSWQKKIIKGCDCSTSRF